MNEEANTYKTWKERLLGNLYGNMSGKTMEEFQTDTSLK